MSSSSSDSDSDSDSDSLAAPPPKLHLPERLFLSGKPVPEETKPFTSGNGVSVVGSAAENGPLEKCRTLLTVSDKARAEDWREGIQTQLVVSSLLSAVTTGFIIESQKKLREDPSEMSVVLLAQLIKQVNQTAELPNIDSKPFSSPSSRDEAVNAFWFTSLALSLATVTVGLLCLQWIQELNKHGETRDSGHYLQCRAAREQGFQFWKGRAIISALPLLLILSLITFFAGLLAFIGTFSWAIIVPIYFILFATSALLLFTTFGPAFISLKKRGYGCSGIPPMPFRSLQSWIAMHAVLYMRWGYSNSTKKILACSDWLSIDHLWAEWSPPSDDLVLAPLLSFSGTIDKVAAIEFLDDRAQAAASASDWETSLAIQRKALQLAKSIKSIDRNHLLERFIRILKSKSAEKDMIDDGDGLIDLDVLKNLTTLRGFRLFELGDAHRDVRNYLNFSAGHIAELVDALLQYVDHDLFSGDVNFLQWALLLVGFLVLLFQQDTSPSDLQSLLDPILCLIHFVFHQVEDIVLSTEVPPETLALLSTGLLEQIRLLKDADAEVEESYQTKIQQIAYIISQHPVWPMVRRQLERLPDADAILMAGPLPPDFDPPSDWNLNLSDHWTDWTTPTMKNAEAEEDQVDGSVLGGSEIGEHGLPGRHIGASSKDEPTEEQSSDREKHLKSVFRPSPIRSLTLRSLPEALDKVASFASATLDRRGTQRMPTIDLSTAKSSVSASGPSTSFMTRPFSVPEQDDEVLDGGTQVIHRPSVDDIGGPLLSDPPKRSRHAGAEDLV